jgi:hypothetical protein
LPGYYKMVREMLCGISKAENRMLNDLLTRARKSVQQCREKTNQGKEPK